MDSRKVSNCKEPLSRKSLHREILLTTKIINNEDY